MAAVAASEQSSSVLLIRKKGLGRKLKISGGGQCDGNESITIC